MALTTTLHTLAGVAYAGACNAGSRRPHAGGGRRLSRGGVALIALMAGLYAGPALAQAMSCNSMYAINANGQVYLTADDGTQTQVASVGSSGWGPFGVSAGGTTMYLAEGATGRVSAYDTASGTRVGYSAIPTLQPGMDGVNGGAVNPANGWFYFAGSNVNAAAATSYHLYAYNLATPATAPVRVGQITGTRGNNGDIGFDSLGNLFLLSGNATNSPANQIYRIGQVPTVAGGGALPATAIATVSSGATANVGGIAFNALGELVVSMSGPMIRRLNPLTGAVIASAVPTAGAVTDLGSCAGGNALTLRKNLPQGRFAATDQFTLELSGGGLAATQTATTAGSAGNVQPQVVGPLLAVDEATFTIDEVAASGNLVDYTRSWQCVDTANGNASVAFGTTFPGSVTMPKSSGATGASVVCTVTNVAGARLTLQKDMPNGRAVATDQFLLRVTDGASADITSTTTGTGSTVTGTATLSGAKAGTLHTLSEAPAGSPVAVWANYIPSYSCTNVRAGGQAPSGTGAYIYITPVVGDDITCTFRNATKPRLTLVKTVTNDHGGTQVPTAWTLSAVGPISVSGTTGSAAVTDANMFPGTYALSESATPGGYVASPYSCVKNGGAAVVGNSIVLAAGDIATCTINNDDSNQADLRIQSSATPAPVRSGERVQFSLVVTNGGPAAAHGAVVSNPAAPGLDCTGAGLPAPTCSASGSAVCPASLTASGLQSGVAIPTLPNGGVVTIGLTCTVTASGLP